MLLPAAPWGSPGAHPEPLAQSSQGTAWPLGCPGTAGDQSPVLSSNGSAAHAASCSSPCPTAQQPYSSTGHWQQHSSWQGHLQGTTVPCQCAQALQAATRPFLPPESGPAPPFPLCEAEPCWGSPLSSSLALTLGAVLLSCLCCWSWARPPEPAGSPDLHSQAGVLHTRLHSKQVSEFPWEQRHPRCYHTPRALSLHPLGLCCRLRGSCK